ncbi:iron reductase [Crepidotus variabilis]|uniref:Iron reductase n=1 Tax=Crepidotus variabilis TaxID=179855 RepID=A0A9P6E7A0_9AGAR|nr:iron reductase [Crepidotus variabilis]
MAKVGAPPVIPPELLPYDSYGTDPKWQLKFTYAWVGVLVLSTVLSLPRVIRAIRRGTGVYEPSNWFGITENTRSKYRSQRLAPISRPASPKRYIWHLENLLGRLGSIFHWTLPGLGLNLGHLILLAGYVATVVVCIVKDSVLVENSNRAGFLAIAQLPVVFLFGTKNSVLSLLLGPGNGYEKLNFIHRWSGRIMFLAAVIHGSLWIRNDLTYNLPILSEEKEGSGIRAFGLLGVLVLFSLRPVRKFFYQGFFIFHVVLFVAFFISICYHTTYAIPWIFPPLAFYGLDIFLRLLRHRIKDAILVPIGKQMTLIHVPYVSSGWAAGQHVRLRVFFSGRIMESHPLTICTASPETTCITSFPPGISFGARAVGDWTKALNQYAHQTAEEIRTLEMKSKVAVPIDDPEILQNEKVTTQQLPTPDIPVQVMIDGPYGGCSVDLGGYESVLLLAGGSGATFTLGLLDDIVGRCVRNGRRNGERTRRIEFVWCIRSFGQIDWFSNALIDIAKVAASSSRSPMPLDLHISVFVTCLCNPEAIPPIPNSDVTIFRPSVRNILLDLITPPQTSSLPTQLEQNEQFYAQDSTLDSTTPQETLSVPSDRSSSDVVLGDAEAPRISSRLPWIGDGGGVAVCASGPASLTREAANAVAGIQLSRQATKIGSVALHTEVFAL